MGPDNSLLPRAELSSQFSACEASTEGGTDPKPSPERVHVGRDGKPAAAALQQDVHGLKGSLAQLQAIVYAVLKGPQVHHAHQRRILFCLHGPYTTSATWAVP